MSEKTDKCKEQCINRDLSLNESICTIINFFMRNKDKKVVDINIYNNFFAIKIYGDFREDIEFDSILLRSLVSLCNQFYYVTVKNKVKTTKVLDFSDSKSGVYKERNISSLAVEDKTNNIGFIFYKNHCSSMLNALREEEKREKLKNYLSNVYNDALSYLKIRCFNELILIRDKDGILLDEKVVNDSIKIQIYKMHKNYKSVEVSLNGIKLKDKENTSEVNYNGYPYRQRGYSFRRLCIYISVDQDNIYLNDNNIIAEVVKSFEADITELINKHKESFRKDKLYYTLDYDKEKMKKIIEITESKNVGQAVKFVLNKFYEEI